MTENNTSSVSTSNNIVAFSFENHSVRGFEYRGEAHFIGNEVTDALGYTNASKALNDHCKALKKLNYNESLEMGLTKQGKNLRGISIIPERDVYRLVMRSNLPTAEAFEEKVVGEILPAIRKTGGYMVAAPEETPEQLALRAMQVLQDTVARQKAELDEAAPKIDAYKKLAALDGMHNIRWAAQQCGWPERKFSDKLCELKWCYRHSVTGRLTVYRATINRGLMDTKNVEVKRTGYVEGVGQPMITQAGLAELRSILGPYEAHTRAEAMKTEIVKRSQSRKAARKPFTKTPA